MSKLIYDRKTALFITEEEYGSRILKFLYHNILGRVLLKLFISRRIFSKLRSLYMKSPFSKKDIKGFVKKYKINLDEYRQGYKSFNDFFIRKKLCVKESLARGIKEGGEDCYKRSYPSVADAKLLIYNLSELTSESKIHIKGLDISIEEILKAKLPVYYRGGSLLVYRLSLSDCHRYIYPDKGFLRYTGHIKGYLHSIRKEACGEKSFAINTRQINVIDTLNFSKIIQVEVGSLLVGHIVNHKSYGHFDKLEEKGYFEFGGSTILQFVHSGIKFDEDILKMSKKGIETKVSLAEGIGYLPDSLKER